MKERNREREDTDRELELRGCEKETKLDGEKENKDSIFFINQASYKRGSREEESHWEPQAFLDQVLSLFLSFIDFIISVLCVCFKFNFSVYGFFQSWFFKSGSLSFVSFWCMNIGFCFVGIRFCEGDMLRKWQALAINCRKVFNFDFSVWIDLGSGFLLRLWTRDVVMKRTQKPVNEPGVTSLFFSSLFVLVLVCVLCFENWVSMV